MQKLKYGTLAWVKDGGRLVTATIHRVFYLRETAIAYNVRVNGRYYKMRANLVKPIR